MEKGFPLCLVLGLELSEEPVKLGEGDFLPTFHL